MFDNIAPAYDRLNHTLSLSVDRIWRRRVVRIVGRLHPRRVLDMATGTGDLAVMMARSIPEAISGRRLVGGMLDVARRKVAARGIGRARDARSGRRRDGGGGGRFGRW